MISNTCRGGWLERAQLLRTLPTNGGKQVGNRVLRTGQFKRVKPPSGPADPILLLVRASGTCHFNPQIRQTTSRQNVKNTNQTPAGPVPARKEASGQLVGFSEDLLPPGQPGLSKPYPVAAARRAGASSGHWY